MLNSALRNGLFVAAAMLASAMMAPAASANGFGMSASGVYGLNLGAIYQGLDQRIPYFAAHPPVYYSYPVPRTYGHAPFAYPPHVATPDMGLAMTPKTIVNPYVETTAPQSVDEHEKTVSSPQCSAGPLVILNPYASQPQVLPASRAL